jgi:hypothetical protein
MKSKKFEMHEIMPEALKNRYNEIGKYDECGFEKSIAGMQFGSNMSDEWKAKFELDGNGNLYGMISVYIENSNLRPEDIQAIQTDLNNKLNDIIINIKNKGIV